MNEMLVEFWSSIDLQFMVKFFVVYCFIIWIAVVIWVMKDISIRTNNLFFQLFCILLVVVGTPLAVFLYLIIRPGKTLYERYYDEIEDNLEIIAELLEERRLQKERGEVPEAPKKRGSILDMLKKDIQETKETGKKIIADPLIRQPAEPKEKKYRLLAKKEEIIRKPKTTLKKRRF